MVENVEAQDRLIESIARRIADWSLTAPAIMFLEANKPFSFIGSQALLFFQPVLGLLIGDETVADYAQFLEDRDNIERLIRRLES